MEKELTKKIFDDFPNLYGTREQRGDRSKNCLYFGIQTEDGWFDLIYNLSKEINRLAESKGIKVKVLQVKEKFGGLRFYVRTADEEVRNLIASAENLSMDTCERCGKSGQKVRSNSGYASNICNECHDKFEEKKKQPGFKERQDALWKEMDKRIQEGTFHI